MLLSEGFYSVSYCLSHVRQVNCKQHKTKQLSEMHKFLSNFSIVKIIKVIPFVARLFGRGSTVIFRNATFKVQINMHIFKYVNIGVREERTSVFIKY